MMCFLGQQKVFTDAEKSLLVLKGVSISAKQIENVCHYYGERIEQDIQIKITSGCPASRTDNKRHYAFLDGGMVLTREEKWKEMKLARIFSEDQRTCINENRGYIDQSTYIAHLGGHKPFWQKVEYHLDCKSEIVFIADGAPWIWKRVETMYPESIQILDFYHAKQHLCEWAELVFKDKNEKFRWIDLQSLLLLNDKVEDVIKNIGKRPAFSSAAKQKKRALLEYYTIHKERMKYRTFKSQGLMIGSGAIEAAHRHVIQQRMKLSGQLWTMKGAQQIANLRVVEKSNQWELVTQLINKAA